MVVSEVFQYLDDSCEHPADILLWDFLLPFAVLLDDVFEGLTDVAVLDEYLSFVIVGAGEGGDGVGSREGVAGGEQVGVGEFAAFVEEGGESGDALLIEDEVLVDSADLFVE